MRRCDPVQHLTPSHGDFLSHRNLLSHPLFALHLAMILCIRVTGAGFAHHKGGDPISPLLGPSLKPSSRSSLIC